MRGYSIIIKVKLIDSARVGEKPTLYFCVGNDDPMRYFKRRIYG